MGVAEMRLGETYARKKGERDKKDDRTSSLRAVGRRALHTARHGTVEMLY